MPRIDFRRHLHGFDGRIHLAEGETGLRQHRVRLGRVRRLRDDGLEDRHGAIRVSRPELHAPERELQVEIRRGERRIHDLRQVLDRQLADLRDRFSRRRRHAAVAPGRIDQAENAVRLDIRGVQRERAVRGVDRLGALVLARVVAGNLGEDFCRFRVERLRALQRVERAGGVALAFEMAGEHELVVGLGRRRARLGRLGGGGAPNERSSAAVATGRMG